MQKLQGIRHFDGGLFVRVPFRWYHLCAIISYTDKGAERELYLDGELNYQTSTGYLPESIWQRGHNLTIGAREFPFSAGVNFNGQVTDVQLFSRKLSRAEAIAYTTCAKVKEEDYQEQH